MAVDGNLVEEVLTGEGEVEKHITARKPIQRVTHAGQEMDKHSNSPKLESLSFSSWTSAITSNPSSPLRGYCL